MIYDAAHAFGVYYRGQSICNYGDLSILSFHAIKVYNTIEGGAMINHDVETQKQIDYLENFGIDGETSVVAPGINSKMNEMQAAFGLLQLKNHQSNIQKRKDIADIYRKELKNIRGLSFLPYNKDVSDYNHSYFPIFVSERDFGKSRDRLYNFLKENNINGRRYFYPLISQFPSYKEQPSSASGLNPVAEKIAEQVICLPIYPDLDINTVKNICSFISYGN